MSIIVGIDLGTSTSEIAILEQSTPSIIPNQSGEHIIPSVVNISPEGKITVGTLALERLLLEPENTVIEVKRFMGSSETIRVNGKNYSPEQISSYILRHLVECAQKHTGEQIDRAVITVPAYFSDRQRQATIEAGKLAGLKVERIINEPTAAALDYGLSNLSECKNILVYDLGGGTLDVTVLEMFEGVLEVKASNGNNHLGGKDFDQALIDYLAEDFLKKYKIDPRKKIQTLMKLKAEAIKCKIHLSTAESYKVSIPFFENIGEQAVALEQEVTRQTFIDLIGEKIRSTGTQIENALRDSGLSNDDIDLVLLVGGSTRIPYVTDFISEVMGKEPKNLVDPDLAVVRGACIQGGIINNQLAENELVIVDVCPYTLGTSVSESFFSLNEVFDPLIPRNTTIPVSIEKIYCTCADFQRCVEIKVYQGEFSDLDKNNFLNAFKLNGVPPAPAGVERIKIIFSYDLNGVLNVKGEIMSTGKSADITIETSNLQMKDEIDTTGWKNMPNAKKYRPIIRKAEKIIKNFGDDANDLSDLVTLIKQGLVAKRDVAYLDIMRDELSDLLEDFEE